jgi:hypothetical protein
MRPRVSADSSAPNAQAGEKRGEIAAHKYEGLTIFQRTSPRRRRDCGNAAAWLDHRRGQRKLDVRNESKKSGRADHFSLTFANRRVDTKQSRIFGKY